MWSMNSELVPYQTVGMQNRKERGYIFPVAIFISVLLSSFLLHQMENYRLEKMFYHETNQQYELEAMMKYSWDMVEEMLKVENELVSHTVTFPKGNAVITVKALGIEREIAIVCTTLEGREYRATIIYNADMKKIVAWYETY